MATLSVPPVGSTLERTSLFSSLTHSTPARCVQLSHNPSVHVYHALKMTIEHSTAGWLRDFLELDGLGSLVEAIEQLSSSRFTGFSDAILLLDCIACVRSVLNTSLGMTFFLNSDIYARKLIKGVSTGSTLSKKHIFELLTAICVHSSLGYHKTIDALQHYQRCTDQTSMFSIVMAELKFSDTALYRTTLMSLLNTVINCTDHIKTRCAMRNELIALQLLDMMHHFRKEEKDADLAIQLEAFSVAKHRDDLELTQNYKLNPNDHEDVFQSTYREVTGKPESADYLNLLQDLYLMTTSNNQSGHLWKAVGKAVHYLSSLSSGKEVEHFIDNLEDMTKSRHSQDKHTDKPSADQEEVALKDIQVTSGSGTCRLDRKDSGISVGSSGSSGSYYDNSRSFHRQGSGRTSGSGSLRGSGRMTCIAEDDVRGVRRRSRTGPNNSLKNLKWIKITKSKVKKEVSLWGQGTDCRLRPNYTGLEQEFPAPKKLQDSDDEVELLTGAQSVAINVYLARMDMSPEELVGYLEDGDDARVGLPGLRYLLSVLPAHDEIIQLRSYRGERYDLGQAEQFLLLLADLPDYRTLLSCLLFKAEFGPRYQKLKTAFTAMIKASRDILHHQGLKDFLFLVLDSGNHLNHGSMFGGAAGLRLSTVARLADVRGQSPTTTLLDHLVRVADAQSDDVTMFAVDIPQLSTAASHDLEELKTEVTQLSTEMRKVLSQLAATHPTVKSTFEFFIEDVKQDLQQLQDSITQTRSLSQQMALYFSEDEADFRLHTTLRQINHLCEAVKKSTKDGIYARQQAARADKRQMEIKQSKAESGVTGAYDKQVGACSTFMTTQPEKIVDYLLKEVHGGHIMGCLGDDLRTPDLEWDPLHFSQIEAASPLQEEMEDPFSLGTLLEEEAAPPCMSDRVDNFISEQYRKDHQVASSSFISSDDEKKPKGPLASPDEFSLGEADPEIWQLNEKADPKPEPPPVRANQIPQLSQLKGTTHRRTASDPNDSQHAVKKWMKYEKQKNTPNKPKTTIESRLPVASLGLEKNGQALSKEDILNMSETANKENAAPISKEKRKKRSFGLLKKISRVLKPRNSDNIPKAEEVPKKAVRPSVLPLNTERQNFVYANRQSKAREGVKPVPSSHQNVTAIENVQDEPLYKIVIYQKYQSDC